MAGGTSGNPQENRHHSRYGQQEDAGGQEVNPEPIGGATPPGAPRAQPDRQDDERQYGFYVHGKIRS
jgi:hypothetical protein